MYWTGSRVCRATSTFAAVVACSKHRGHRHEVGDVRPDSALTATAWPVEVSPSHRPRQVETDVSAARRHHARDDRADAVWEIRPGSHPREEAPLCVGLCRDVEGALPMGLNPAACVRGENIVEIQLFEVRDQPQNMKTGSAKLPASASSMAPSVVRT